MITSDNAIYVVLGVLLVAAIIARVLTSGAFRSTMKACPRCSKRVRSGAAKCVYCGATLA
jgi:hypothetical protein